MLWNELAEFILRLSFGIAAAMLTVPPAMVPAGFFRVHLWVLMGLGTFAALALRVAPPDDQGRAFWLTVATVICSYVGAVIWLYERRRAGIVVLALVAALNLLAALSALPLPGAPAVWQWWGQAGDAFLGGLLMGTTITAMLLGHWYLNTPSMKLKPLQFLVAVVFVLAVVRAVWCGSALAAEWTQGVEFSRAQVALWGLRWLAGLVGVAILAMMTWATLKIPNTQSATGILYVAVIFVFLGELTSQLLLFPGTHPL